MRTYSELVEQARLCWHQAHLTQDRSVASIFRKMAHDLQKSAAELDSGKLPELDDPKADKPLV